MNKEEFEFLKTYYKLLQGKSNKDIGNRFLSQIKTLVQSGEISQQTKNIIESCIAIGLNSGDTDKEGFDIIKEFIEIGTYMKEERDSQKVANKLAEKTTPRSSSSSSDPCSPSYSGRSSGGC